MFRSPRCSAWTLLHGGSVEKRAVA
ncbi:hypothetical protein ALC57_06196 [Trachymyrmex cornetzi]|uniref:Uncharacterized protein n=1 Tax=Trachymyrmex cornetzi TaxID=471704 RepID=A0A151J8Y3_9HYME|nr:hypothetical protein ALC57_06196 [Trachymyrmex cornetzi]